MGGGVALPSRVVAAAAWAWSTEDGVPVRLVLEAGVGGDGWLWRATRQEGGIIEGRTASNREADALEKPDPWV